MKKLVIAFATLFIGTVVFAQIGKVETHTPEYNNRWLVGDPRNDILIQTNNETNITNYYLVVTSSNQFESKKVMLSLGNSNEVLESLNNLLELASKDKHEFTLQGYECRASTYLVGGIAFLNNNENEKLAYSAGSYFLFTPSIKKFIKMLTKEFKK
ncbi:MAG: hypothetical protein IJ270_04200 [Paludibacteraceae bacterium]|nr:hypothetical protein [Paludibacteraceae bacterium]